MSENETNITKLQDKLWYVIKFDDETNSGNGTQNLNTIGSNEFVIIQLYYIIVLCED